MEVLTPRLSQAARALRVAVFIAFCGIYAVVMARLVHNQIRIESYIRNSEKEAGGEHAIARLASREGNVLVLRSGALDNKELKTGDPLFGGDRIQTAAHSGATLAFGPKTRIHLNENALMLMPSAAGGAGAESGNVLKVTSGTLSIDSNELGGEVAALQTRHARISFRVRKFVIYSPGKGGKAKTAAAYSRQYLGFLTNHYFPLLLYNGLANRTYVTAWRNINELIQKADAICRTRDENACIAAQNTAWRAIRAWRKKLGQDNQVRLTISVSQKGEENITVQKGAVNVETGGRVIAVKQGDKINLSSEGGIKTSIEPPPAPPAPPPPAPTPLPKVEPAPAPPAPAPAPRPKPKKEEPYFEIDSQTWQ